MSVYEGVIRFIGRKPIPSILQVGEEGEHNVQEVRMDNLPQISPDQVASMYILLPDGTSGDAELIVDNKVTLTRTLMQAPGYLTCWIVISVSDVMVWKSDIFKLKVSDLPSIEEAIEQQYPSGFETAINITGTNAAAARAAADEAENYRDDAAASAQTASAAAASASNSAQQAAGSAESAANSADEAAEYTQYIEDYVDDAAASANSAAQSASAAETSAQQAGQYAEVAQAASIGVAHYADEAEDYAAIAASSAQQANQYATAAGVSASQASVYSSNASQKASAAELSANAAASSASAAAASANQILGMDVEATTLAPGSQATADYQNGVLTLGLPQGATGPTGPQGPAGQGVPTGGSTGQVLKKKSGTNYDTEWSNESGAVTDVQVNGSSVVNNGVANIPAGALNTLGAVKVDSNGGLTFSSIDAGRLMISNATDALIKSGANAYRPVTPSGQHAAAFYGLAKAAGDTTQARSNNAVGTYTDAAKSAIKNMLGISDEEVSLTLTLGIYDNPSISGEYLIQSPTDETYDDPAEIENAYYDGKFIRVNNFGNVYGEDGKFGYVSDVGSGVVDGSDTIILKINFIQDNCSLSEKYFAIYYDSGTAEYSARDITSSIPSGSGLPSGGSANQVLRKNSANTAAEWGGYSVPAGGSQGQALVKQANNDGFLKWETLRTLPSTDGATNGDQLEKSNLGLGYQWVTRYHVPTGGNFGQVLYKTSNSNGALGWKDVVAIPTGGSANQVLKKNSGNTALEWGGYSVPAGGTAGQVLKKSSLSSGATEWGDPLTNPAAFDVFYGTYDSGGTIEMGWMHLAITFEIFKISDTPARYSISESSGMEFWALLNAHRAGRPIVLRDDSLEEDPEDSIYYTVCEFVEGEEVNDQASYILKARCTKSDGTVSEKHLKIFYDTEDYDWYLAEDITPADYVSRTLVISQSDYNTLVTNDTVDPHTLYCIKEAT